MATPDPTHLNELLALMEDAEGRFVRLLPTGPTSPSYGKLVAGSLLSDCLSLHLGIRLLLEKWLSQEAGALQRKLAENSAALVYLGGSHGRLETLAVEFMHALTKKELAQWHADHQAYGDGQASEGLQATKDELQRLKDRWHELGNTGKVPPFPKTDALLKKMGQGDSRRLWVQANLYAHPSASGFEGRLNQGRTDAIVFDTHTDPNRGVPIGASSLSLLFGAGQGAAGALGWPDTFKAIQEMRDDVGAKVVPLMRAARGEAVTPPSP
jgi:hypothetical protein